MGRRETQNEGNGEFQQKRNVPIGHNFGVIGFYSTYTHINVKEALLSYITYTLSESNNKKKML